MGRITAPAQLGGVLHFLHNDDLALKWFLSHTCFSGKLVCWRLRLLELTLDAVRCVNVTHQANGTLLRRRTPGTNQTSIKDEITVMCTIAIIGFQRERQSLCVCKTTTYLRQRRNWATFSIRYCGIDGNRIRQITDTRTEAQTWTDEWLALSKGVIYSLG